jgi:NADPH-dependent 7-cyano-7-deazaguanine reductase QueF
MTQKNKNTEKVLQKNTDNYRRTKIFTEQCAYRITKLLTEEL